MAAWSQLERPLTLTLFPLPHRHLLLRLLDSIGVEIPESSLGAPSECHIVTLLKACGNETKSLRSIERSLGGASSACDRPDGSIAYVGSGHFPSAGQRSPRFARTSSCPQPPASDGICRRRFDDEAGVYQDDSYSGRRCRSRRLPFG